MKILFLTNNKVSAPLRDWLNASDAGGRCEVVVSEERLACADLIDIEPDFIISYSYKHIIKPEVLAMMPDRVVNLHISMLPFNRGADPNPWSFLENTPKGVSIHLIDAGIDTGPILVQKEVFFDERSETLARSYDTLHGEIQALFRGNWHRIRSGAARAVPQTGAGSFHSAREFAQIRDHLLQGDGWAVGIGDLKQRYSRISGKRKS